MAHVDLHLHTTYSDGTLSPEALVAMAGERDVALIAITDHDEISGIIPAQHAGAACGVQVLSGVEINTEVGRENVHILGYGFPADSPVMHAGLHELRTWRLERAMKMLERLRTIGYPLEAERVLAIAGHGSIGRPHIARALVEVGYMADISTAFDKLIGNRGPAYIPRTSYQPERAIALIHRAGGFASLAHPGKLGDPIRIIRRLLEGGLDALEVYHSDHPAATTERLRLLAQRFNLLITGGTDSHGPDGPRVVPVGAVPVPDEVGQAVLAEIRRRSTE